MLSSTRLNELLSEARDFLKKHGVEDAKSDSEWLIADALGLRRTELFCYPEHPIAASELQRIYAFLERRGVGEPVQYITGSTGFFNTEILVGPGVLIPRPETEILVETALKLYSGTGDILDLCTGSGAILFAMAKELPDCPPLIGVDNSKTALSWAAKNSSHIDSERITFLKGDLFAPVSGRQFEIITANPPYISPAEYSELPITVREHEPREALYSDGEGLETFTRIIQQGRHYLSKHGWLICEIGEAQGDRARDICRSNGWQNCEILKDFNRKERIIIAQNGPPSPA